MTNKKIVGLSSKEWSQILDLPKYDPRRQAKESELFNFIEENPKDLLALILGFSLVKDVFIQNKYVKNIVQFAKTRGNYSDYIASVYACRMGNRLEEADELSEAMKSQYPVKGRIMDFLLKMYAMTSADSESGKKTFLRGYLRGMK